MMKFSPGFRIAYWLALIAVLSRFLLLRLDDAISGHATAADALVFGVWVALLLAPLFSEVQLFGIKLKQQIENAKEEIKRDLVSLKTDIRSVVDVRSSVSQNTYLSAPPDAQLPLIETQVVQAVERTLAAWHPNSLPSSPLAHPLNDDTLFLIQIRRELEIEMRRIARERQLFTADRPLGGHQLSKLLAQSELVEPDLLRAIRDVYSVCSPAVHGETVSTAKVAFVRDVGPGLVRALQAIH